LKVSSPAGSHRVRGSIGALIVSTLVSSLAGFLFGYDNIVISGAIGHLSRYYRLQPVAVGWAAGCALVGCLLGSATSGVLADRFGLKRVLYACAACFALSSFGVWMAASFAQFVVWRIIGGVGIGSASIVAPMYIAEIAPASVRGRLVVFYQLGIVVGILGAVYVNMLIEGSGSEQWNVEHGWRWMFAAGAVPAIIFARAIAFSKESPRWLMKAGYEQQAQDVLVAINGVPAADAEGAEIRKSLAQEEGGLQELFSGPFRRALLIGFLLAAFSQTSGITCLLSFLPEVFKSAGQRSSDAFFQAVLVGIVNLVFTLLAVWLVDRAGRKTLILLGTCMQTLALGMIASLYWIGGAGLGILAGIMAFVAGHAIGNGAVCWVVISEIFPTKVRGRAASIATSALWSSTLVVTFTFLILVRKLGLATTFAIYGGLSFISLVYIWKMVPETKGKTLEQIQETWNR